MDDDVVGRVETCLEFVVSQPDAKYTLDSNCLFDVNNACNSDTINEIKLHILEHELMKDEAMCINHFFPFF